MIMAGMSIQTTDDRLVKVQEEYLYHSIVNPKPHIAATIRQLRIVYGMDAAGYSQLKRQLPYVVCGMFTPAVRRTENFAYTEAFILDFDHLGAKQIALEDARRRICADERVMLCFASPSEDGLKVLFRLSERCYDRGLYSIFYKEFARAFAIQMGLDQVVDGRTSDVTRACFVSHDPRAHFNPDAVRVDMSTYASADDPLTTLAVKAEQTQRERMARKEEPKEPRHHEPTDEVMAAIRQRLKPGSSPKERLVVVPERLNELIDPLKEYIGEVGLQVSEVVNIQYAKKIRARLGTKSAEVNLFLGKRGFSVVISPRRGTDDELNQLLADVIRSFLDNGSVPAQS